MNKINDLLGSKNESRKFQYRIFRGIVIMILLLSILIWRLGYMQTMQHQYYLNLSEHNQQEQLPVEPNRGLIFDRNGVLVAENIPIFSLDIIPDRVKNLNATIDEIKSVIKISDDDIKSFRKSLKRHHRSEPVSLKLKLSQEEVAKFYLNQYHFPGIVVSAGLIRHYPLKEIMASVLGYVGRINPDDLKNIDINNYRASNFIGKTGIEKYYENELHGRAGIKIVEINAAGKPVRTTKYEPPTAGDNLYLTIDSKLQQIAMEAMEEESGSVIAIDPNNGEVLAMVSTPSFDPNLFANGIDNESYDTLRNSSDKPLFNRAIRSHYPFASTIKPYLALAGLNEGIINTSTKIYDPGYFKLPHRKQPFRDWVHNGHGIVDVTKAITESCDVFFYTLAVKLGIEKIDEILEKFGFGEKSGIDISDEKPGLVASPDWVKKHLGHVWYPGYTVNSGIGQGFMAATPLQLAAGVATLANHGKRFQPHLVFKFEKENKAFSLVIPKALAPVKLSNSTAWDIVIDAMEKVVNDPKGTATYQFGRNHTYTVAGKTGGAQLFHHKIVNEYATPLSEEGIAKKLRNHKLFIAFAPIKKPQIAVAVVSENSTIAPTVARKVIDYYLLHQEPEEDNDEEN